MDLRRINGQREVWPALKQRLERASAFDAGELVTEAEVDARAKRDMPVRPPIEVESLAKPGTRQLPRSRAHRYNVSPPGAFQSPPSAFQGTGRT